MCEGVDALGGEFGRYPEPFEEADCRQNWGNGQVQKRYFAVENTWQQGRKDFGVNIGFVVGDIVDIETRFVFGDAVFGGIG